MRGKQKPSQLEWRRLGAPVSRDHQFSSICYHKPIKAKLMTSMYPFLRESFDLRVFCSADKRNVSRPALKGQSVPWDVRRCLPAPLQGQWDEFWFNTTDVTVNKRFLMMFFIDVDAGLEAIGEEVIDGSIPYDVITVETGERLETVSSSLESNEGVGNGALGCEGCNGKL